MSYERKPDLIIEDATLLYRNFAGEERGRNRKGDRNFCVYIDDEELAEKLSEDKWNVKIKLSENPDEKPRYFLPVAVRYDNYPPEINLVTETNMTLLDEDSVGCLDQADILHVDLVIRPSVWEKPTGEEAIKAYCNTMYVTIRERPFEAKYARYRHGYEGSIDEESVRDNKDEIPF